MRRDFALNHQTGVRQTQTYENNNSISVRITRDRLSGNCRTNNAGGRATARWRLSRSQHGREAKCSFKPHYGGFNTAVGWVSLRNNTTGSFNTAVGAATLFRNIGDENTATGTAAL